MVEGCSRNSEAGRGLSLAPLWAMEFLAEDEKEERHVGGAEKGASTILGSGLLDLGLSDCTWRLSEWF